MAKERLDVLLVNKGFFETREKAQKNIMAGLVFIDNNRVDKCGEKVSVDAKIDVKGEAIPYVSRGGLKLEKAINTFNINLSGKVCADIGASTGGFTDCMLKNEASKVFAIDVGYGQFAWELRTDKRVVCMERTNVRYVKPEDLGEMVDFASIDVSFISLKLVFNPIKEFLKADGEIVALIKPQFEAGRDKVGKKGVVREASTHLEVIKHVVDYATNIGIKLIGLTYSPIKGPEGNIEYLAYFKKTEVDNFDNALIEDKINKVVEESHKSL